MNRQGPPSDSAWFQRSLKHQGSSALAQEQLPHQVGLVPTWQSVSKRSDFMLNGKNMNMKLLHLFLSSDSFSKEVGKGEYRTPIPRTWSWAEREESCDDSCRSKQTTKMPLSASSDASRHQAPVIPHALATGALPNRTRGLGSITNWLRSTASRLLFRTLTFLPESNVLKNSKSWRGTNLSSKTRRAVFLLPEAQAITPSLSSPG